ncbi:hypothetical protein PIB30_087656 [Stylosanthes scabra]|uniref:Uncharacterized protein n=1 Tax=Stylosanthes scabra TaxID=79078 RepID=A0ABU6VT42_9FABA|nr:hypothetical protein [Stylosanthes scabra]
MPSKLPAGLRKSPAGCEVLHEAVGQVAEVLNAIRWDGIEPRQGFALYGVGSIHEQHPIFEGIQMMLRICSSVIRLDLNRISEILGEFLC